MKYYFFKITKTHKMNKKVKEIKEIISKKSPIWNKKKMYNYKSTKDKTKKYYGYEIQNKNDNELISMKMKEVKKNEEKGIFLKLYFIIESKSINCVVVFRFVF